MELRSHPLMSYRNGLSWPPIWMWIDGKENQHPRGEVGVLKRVKPYDPGAHLPVCFLWIEHEDSTYLGFLLFDDRSFCQQVTRFLQDHCGSSIEEISGLDLG
jgi:hypothetical protein